MEGDASTSLASETNPYPETGMSGINQEEEAAAAAAAAADATFASMASVRSRKTLENFSIIKRILSPGYSKWTQEWVQMITTRVQEISYLPAIIRDNFLNILHSWQPMNANANANADGLAPVAAAIPSISRVEDPPDDSLQSYMALLDEEKCRMVNALSPDMQLAFAREFSKMARTIAEDARTIAEKDCVIAEKDQALTEKDCVIAEKDQALTEVISQNDLLSIVTRMHESIAEAHHFLHALAQMSQGERTMQSNMTTQTRLAAEACIPEKYEFAGTLFSQQLAHLVAAAQKLDFEPRNNEEGSNGSEQDLQNVAGAWEVWIDQGTGKPTSKRLAKNVGLIWMQEKTKKPYLKKKNPPPPFPGVMSDEVAGTQPALEALLTCLANRLNNDCTPYTPPKTHLKQNQIIPKSAHRAKRIVDFCMGKPGQFKFLMFDHALNLVLEVKPLLRQNGNMESLHHQSFEQTLGHLAKLVYQGLNLFGIGTSTFATGIMGNLAYISVYKLELIMKPADLDGNVAKLQLYVSDKLPLMTISCFDKWTQHFLGTNKKNDKTKWEEEIKNLRLELYGEGVVKENDGGASAENIPLGIRVLWGLMKKRRQELFGPNYEDIFKLGSNKELLGIGSFSMVFNYHDGKAVLKVGTDPSSDHIANEIRILQKLNRNLEDIDGLALPVLKEILELTIELGGVKTTSQGLVLSPKGNGIQSFCRDVCDPGKFLDRIIPTLVEALKFIHKHDIIHNDVSPKNIIVQGDESNGRAFLVDFGCASDKNTELTGFVGTPRYAHVDVFHRYPGIKWHPKNKYDYFSLGLSLSWLVLPPGENWNMGRFPLSLSSGKVKEELEDLISKRITMAKDLVQGSGCEEETKKIWMQCLDCEQVTRTTGRKRKRA